MKPLAPLHPEGNTPSSRDEAGTNGYPLRALEDLLSDCDTQPLWRDRADRAHRFYDMGKQMTPEMAHKIRVDWGIEPREVNLVHGIINTVLGNEAKARVEKRLFADGTEMDEVVEALQVKYKEAQREARIDLACSDAYGDGVKGGAGWIEVSRATDPLDYPYRVKKISRREIWWDMRPDQDKTLEECRWQVRRRWVDMDEAIAQMPEHEQVLRYAVDGWPSIDLPNLDMGDSPMGIAYRNERSTRISRDRWLDGRRRRIQFFEVWYRVPAKAAVMVMGAGKRVQVDETNPMHVLAIKRGLYPIEQVVTRQIRMALFAGPHRLMDVATKRRRFPYIPVFAFLDDEDGSPYGMIEGMIAPQEEFNERRQMLSWMLKARQLFIDDDAVSEKYNTIADVTANVMRADFVAVLNANRRNANGIRIGADIQAQREQVEMMMDAKQLMQDVPRVYSSMMGNAASGVTSGIANSVLIEAGITAMGELNDNYRTAQQLVHEALVDLIVEDHLEENLRVAVGEGEARRVVVLNTWTPEGEPVNRVKDVPVKVALGDVPVSPAARQSEQQQVAQIIQGLNGMPQAMAVLAPAYIEGSSLANRKQVADDLRRALGVPVAADKQAMAAAQKQQADMAAQAAALQAASAKADVAKKAADADLSQAKAQQIRVQSDVAQRQQVLAETQAVAAAMAPPDEDALIKQAIAEAMGSQPQPMQPQDAPMGAMQ